MKQYLIVALCILFISCEKSTTYTLDEQAHRGGRGLMPENTIAAMLDAIDRGVTTLELDLQITKDKQVVLSHDAFLNEKIATTPDGKELTKEESRNAIIYNMTYDSLARYDVGQKAHPDFPQQKKMTAQVPLLADVIKEAEAHAKVNNKTIAYNIEIKTREDREQKGNHPPVDEFIDLAMAVIQDGGILDRTIVQSFDMRALKILHEKYPKANLSFLVEIKQEGTVEEQFQIIGFVPHTYSPNHSVVTQEMIDYCHSKGVKIVPWTINDIETMKEQYEWGVDGIITDYPNLFEELRQSVNTNLK